MFHLDFLTLSLVIGLTGFVGIAVMHAVWRINPELQGPGVWLVASVIGSLGFFILLFRPQIGSLATAMNNMASLATPLLIVEGILRFRGLLGDPKKRLPVLLVILLYIVAAAWINRDDPVRRFQFHDPLGILILLGGAVALMWRTTPLQRQVHGISAATFVAVAAGLAWRMYLAWTEPASVAGGNHPVMVVIFLLIIFWGLGSYFGLSLAVNLRGQEAIAELARTDPLTGLANRRSFDEAARRALELCRRRTELLGIALFDIDGFKRLNDNFGHYHGDTVLKALADRLRHVTRSSDLPARLGGDEFVVLLENGRDPESLQRAVERLRQELQRPLDVEGRLFDLKISIGFSFFPHNGQNVGDLLRAADISMYADKRAKGHGDPAR